MNPQLSRRNILAATYGPTPIVVISPIPLRTICGPLKRRQNPPMSRAEAAP